MDGRVNIRELTSDPCDMAQLQGVLEAAPSYAHLVTGCPVGPADAQSLYSILPEGKAYDDKFVFAISLGERMVGCVDLIRGYPDASTAQLGLLLIDETFQNLGVGRAAYGAIEDCVRAWNTCTRIRIGVVGTNANVLGFWTRQGFQPTGDIKPYRYASVISETIILIKTLSLPVPAKPHHGLSA